MISTLVSPIGRWQTGRSTQHIRAAGCHASLPHSQDATSGTDRLRLSVPHFSGVLA
jgi:hypothetical protein